MGKIFSKLQCKKYSQSEAYYQCQVNGSRQCTSNLEKVITCTVCNHVMSKPRCLPYLHVFCEGCLVQWAEWSVGHFSQGCLGCPTCYDEHLLPPSVGIRMYPRAYWIEQLVEYARNTAHRPPPPSAAANAGEAVGNGEAHATTTSCLLCSQPPTLPLHSDQCTPQPGSAETVGGQATHFCTTCCYMLCSRCKERHVAQAVFATHSCIVLARADNCPEASHYNCIRHPSHPYPYSCKSCNVGGLCSVCVSVDHIDHDVTLTADLGRSPFKRSSSSLAVNPAKRCCVDGGHVVTDNDNHVHVDEDARNESRVIGAPHSDSQKGHFKDPLPQKRRKPDWVGPKPSAWVGYFDEANLGVPLKSKYVGYRCTCVPPEKNHYHINYDLVEKLTPGHMLQMRIYRSHPHKKPRYKDCDIVLGIPNAVTIHFERSSDGGEKEVDCALSTDVTRLTGGELCVNDCYTQHCVCGLMRRFTIAPDTCRLVFFTGDRDMQQSVKHALNCGWHVDVVTSFPGSEAPCYKQEKYANDPRLRVIPITELSRLGV